jgi:hypothetical protein
VNADPGAKRREARLRAFLPKRGALRIHTTTSYEYDGNTPPEDRKSDEESTKRVAFQEVTLATFKEFFSPGDDQKVSLVWKAIGGTVYLVGIEIEEHRFIGCPC